MADGEVIEVGIRGGGGGEGRESGGGEFRIPSSSSSMRVGDLSTIAREARGMPRDALNMGFFRGDGVGGDEKGDGKRRKGGKKRRKEGEESAKRAEEEIFGKIAAMRAEGAKLPWEEDGVTVDRVTSRDKVSGKGGEGEYVSVLEKEVERLRREVGRAREDAKRAVERTWVVEKELEEAREEIVRLHKEKKGGSSASEGGGEERSVGRGVGLMSGADYYSEVMGSEFGAALQKAREMAATTDTVKSP